MPTPPTSRSPVLFNAVPAADIAAVRLVVIEENRTKAELWQYLCQSRWGFDVVARCHTGAEGIAAVSQLHPDLILAGLQVPDMSIAGYLKGLRSAGPSTKLLLLSTVCNEYLVHTIKPGDWDGFIFEPDENLASLSEMIARARQGQRVSSVSILRCQSQLRMQPDAFPKLLSARHEEVLVCIAHAMTDTEIALHLGITKTTALSHRQTIMKKLNIHSTPKLIRYCADKGFNSVPPPAARTA